MGLLVCLRITGEVEDFGINLLGCHSGMSLQTRWEPQNVGNVMNLSRRLERGKKEVESRCWNYETMQNRGLRLQGIVFSSFLEAVLLLLSNLCWPHGTRLAIGQKIISTGHELEISSWGMDPISNQGWREGNLNAPSCYSDSVWRVCQKLLSRKNTAV